MSPPARKLDPWTLLLWLGLAAVSLVALYRPTPGPAADYIGPDVTDIFARQCL